MAKRLWGLPHSWSGRFWFSGVSRLVLLVARGLLVAIITWVEQTVSFRCRMWKKIVGSAATTTYILLMSISPLFSTWFIPIQDDKGRRRNVPDSERSESSHWHQLSALQEHLPLQAQSFLCKHKGVYCRHGQSTMNCSAHFHIVKTPRRSLWTGNTKLNSSRSWLRQFQWISV